MGRHSESPPVSQETISQGAYHTHTQLISKVCLGTEPDYQDSTNPGSL